MTARSVAHGERETLRIDSRSPTILIILLAISFLFAVRASATCFPPPSPGLRSLDRAVDDHPNRALAQAQLRLARPPAANDPLLAAELHAIAADAALQAGRPDAVQMHLAAGLAALERAPAGNRRDTLGIRLRLTEVTDQMLAGTTAKVGARIDAILARPGLIPAVRSCVLATRSLFNLRNRSLADAAGDGIEAYQLAISSGDPYARMNAAYVLAAIYSQAGLAAQAAGMIDEVTDYAERKHSAHLRMLASFMQARILDAERRYPAALVAARTAQSLALANGAPLNIAAATVGVCAELVNLGSYATAARSCRIDESPLVAAHRGDLLGELHAQQARLDLAAHRPRAAIRRLDAVLGPGGTPLGPAYLARYLHYRAAAFDAVGDLTHELADLRRAEALENRVDDQDHVTAVAVISAMNERRVLLAHQRELQARIDNQRMQLRDQALVRELLSWFALATLILLALLTHLLRQSLRRGRSLRRQQAMLNTILRHAPDGMALLDDRGTVQYANRNPFDSTPADCTGRRLLDCVPAPMLATLRSALEAVYERRTASTMLAVDGAERSPARSYEMRAAPVLENGEFVGAVVRVADVTASRRLEREVVEASNRERLRLSSDLHEGIGQKLTGIALLLGGVVADLERNRPADRASLAQIAAHLSDSIEMVRTVARGLSPIAVARGSLSDALCRLAIDFERAGGMRVDARAIAAGIVVEDEAADHLYRIANEALINAHKHSSGALIRLSLARVGESLLLRVEDDGRGMADPGASEGLGLRLIEYRAHLLGGRVAIDSGRGRGTRISVLAAWSRCSREAPAGTRERATQAAT
ncbi:MAG: PAS domain-containing protein [Gammaproteobacteria bacterium]|nr:PAS domain-containing protein [Gammaproteobacteria bacterium]